MDIEYNRVLRGILGLTLALSIGYRLTAGPFLQGQSISQTTMVLMETVTLISGGLAMLFSGVAVWIVWLSLQVDDPTTRHRLQKNALIGGSSPLFVAFLVWLTGVPLPV